MSTADGSYFFARESGALKTLATYKAMPLAMAPKVRNIFFNERSELDLLTGASTCIPGSRLPPEQGQAVSHGIASRVQDALWEGAPGTPAFDWKSPGFPERLAAFFFSNLTTDQESRLRALHVNTDGVESTD